MSAHILKIENIKSDGIIETIIARSSGKTRKALISRVNLNTKEVEIIVLDNYEEIILDTIEEAINKYNSIHENNI